MICRLCLKDIEDVLNIFDNNGQDLNVAAVVGKHFWFEVNMKFEKGLRNLS